MPLARTFDAAAGRVTSTLHDGYLDRLSRWSDIQEYLPFLHATARSYRNAWVLELGTRTGNSAFAFLAAAEVVNGHVTSADIDRVTDYPPLSRLAGCPWWTFVRGDDMHPAVRAALPAEVDVLFIDTSHEYDHTLAELRAYVPRVAPGGTVLLHDTKVYLNEGGTCVSSLVPHRGEKIPPVAQALDDYCAESGLSWENLPGSYGLGIIRVSGPAAA